MGICTLHQSVAMILSACTLSIYNDRECTHTEVIYYVVECSGDDETNLIKRDCIPDMLYGMWYNYSAGSRTDS